MNILAGCSQSCHRVLIVDGYFFSSPGFFSTPWPIMEKGRTGRMLILLDFAVLADCLQVTTPPWPSVVFFSYFHCFFLKYMNLTSGATWWRDSAGAA